MEEKDLSQGQPDTEAVNVEPETVFTEQPAEQTDAVFEMAATETPAEKIPATEPSLRERLRESVQGQPVKTAGFMKRGGLFEGYEINNAKEMPFFVRVFAASALFHLVVFASALQLPAAVETTCESTEFTQQLCDTIYVASLLSNSNRGFIDEEVTDPTEIPDAINGEEVTMLTASDFNYPEGYWTLQDEINGVVPIEEVGMFNPSISDVNGGTSSPPMLNLNGPQVLPNQNPNAVNDDLAGINSPFKVGGGSTGTGGGPLSGSGKRGGSSKNGGSKKNPAGISDSPTGLPPLSGGSTEPGIEPNGGQGKNPTVPGQSDVADKDAYNKQPLYKFRDWLVEWRKNENNTFDKKFEYSINGKVDKDGKLKISEKPLFTSREEDKQMEELVRSGVEAFSDSGMFKLLTDLQSKNVKITFVQDGNQFNIKLESLQESDKMANRLYFGINGALVLGKMAVEAGIVKEPDPKNKEKEQATLDLLKMAKLRREGTTIIIDTVVPNTFVESMYETYKKDLEEKKSKQGIAVNSKANSTEVK